MGALTLGHLFSSRITEVFDVTFGVRASLDFELTLEVKETRILPVLKSNFILDWGWNNESGFRALDIGLMNTRLDVGSLVSNFLKPIAERVASVLEPVRPVVEVLTKRVKGLDKLLDDPNLMGLINLLLKKQGQKPIDWSFVDAAKTMLSLVDGVNSLLNTKGEILLGNFRDLASGIPFVEAPNPDEIVLPEDLNRFLHDLDAESQGKAVKDALGAEESSFTPKDELFKSEDRSGFLIWPYLRDPGNWLKLLTGGDATLFTYEMPLLTFGFSFRQTLAVIPIAPYPVSIDITAFGGFSATVDLGFGFDTFGNSQIF